MTDVTPDDIEVGRFAVRTFRIRLGVPQSLCIQLGTGLWKEGVCEAQCLEPEFSDYYADLWGHPRLRSPRESWYPMRVRHSAPQLDCSCGIYGSLSLSGLDDQYQYHSRALTAVIAAEGRTIIGSRGLRTERARVVAYTYNSSYYPPGSSKPYGSLDVHFPGATQYEIREDMARDYGIALVGPSCRNDSLHRGQNQLWREGEVENG